MTRYKRSYFDPSGRQVVLMYEVVGDGAGEYTIKCTDSKRGEQLACGLWHRHHVYRTIEEADKALQEAINFDEQVFGVTYE